jgi:tripartite-type tricarboxylate transporter receptor subunit TctC
MRLKFLCAAALLAAAVQTASAQGWPTKPIRVVIPFGAGSVTDVVPRTILDAVAIELGQPIIVENRPGGGTTIGTNMVAKADPDGYTLLATSSAHTISHVVFASLPYDTEKDFVGVAPLTVSHGVMITSPAKSYKTAGELIAAAKARPGTFNFASPGVGTAAHLGAERFRMAAGFEAVHIPFKGGAEALTEVMSGRVDYYFCPLGTSLPLIAEGKVRALAAGSATRLAALPDVPSVLEVQANSDYTPWLGLFGPARLPKHVVDKINQATQKVLRTAAMKEKLAKMGAEPMLMGSPEFTAFVSREIASGGALARAVGLKSN